MFVPIILPILLWFTSSISITILFKIISTYNITCFVTCITLFIQGSLVSLYLGSFPRIPDKNYIFVIYLNAFYILSANFSLKFATLVVYTIFKNSSPIICLITNYIFFSRNKFWTSALATLLISIGALFSLYKPGFFNEENFDLKNKMGYLLCFIMAICSGTRFIFTKILFNRTNLIITLSPPENESDTETVPLLGVVQNKYPQLEFIKDTSIYMSLVIFPFIFFEQNDFEKIDYFYFLFQFLAILICGLLINIGEYTVVKNLKSPLSIAFIEIGKEIILILISVLFFQEYVLYILNYIGFLLSFIGIYYYVYITRIT